MPKSIVSLNLGFSDAQNYTQRGNKQMLSEVFVKNAYLTKLLRPNVYYLTRCFDHNFHHRTVDAV